MASSGSSPSDSLPSMSSPAPMSPPHLNSRCPSLIKKDIAIRAANHVYNRAINVQEDQRGRTPWLGLKLDDLPSSAECMSANADTGTEFPSLEAAQEYRKLLLEDATTIDNTIPRTPAQLRAHAFVLFKAFKCIPEECQDRDDMKKWFVEQRHNNQLVEVKCWEILQECINRSVTATNLVEAHEPHKFKFKSGAMTFAQRFNIIKETMALSKTICKHLFDVSFTLKFVDDPAHNRARVESNRILNTKKAEIMKRGKEQQAKEESHAKRPRLMQDVASDPNSAKLLDDPEYIEMGETPVKTQTPRVIRTPRPRTLDRTRAASSRSAIPMGSMSAPQMRAQMYSPARTPQQNPAFQGGSSPSNSFSSPMGTTAYFSDDDQFMAASNLSTMAMSGSMNGSIYQSPTQQSQILSPSAFPTMMSPGVNLAAQSAAYPMVRPESSMSQRAAYQPLQHVSDQWPQTPTPRRGNFGPIFYNANSSSAGGNPLAGDPMVDPAILGGFSGAGWITPSAPTAVNGPWGRQAMGPSQPSQLVSPTPRRPGEFAMPQDASTLTHPDEERLGEITEGQGQEERDQQREKSSTPAENAGSVSSQATIDEVIEDPSFETE